MWLALRRCLIRKVKVMGYQHNRKTSSVVVLGTVRATKSTTNSSTRTRRGPRKSSKLVLISTTKHKGTSRRDLTVGRASQRHAQRIPDSRYEDRGRQERRGALGVSQKTRWLTLENPVITNLRSYSAVYLGIYTSKGIGQGCTRVR